MEGWFLKSVTKLFFDVFRFVPLVLPRNLILLKIILQHIPPKSLPKLFDRQSQRCSRSFLERFPANLKVTSVLKSFPVISKSAPKVILEILPEEFPESPPF